MSNEHISCQVACQGNIFTLTQSYQVCQRSYWTVTGVTMHTPHLYLPLAQHIDQSSFPGEHCLHAFRLEQLSGAELVESLFIPDSYKYIYLRNDMFPNLVSLEVSPTHESFKAQGCMLLSKNGAHLYYVMAAGLRETLRVPKSVKYCEEDTFANTSCKRIVFSNPKLACEPWCFANSVYLETHDTLIIRDHFVCLLKERDTVYLPNTVRVLNRGCFGTYYPQHLRCNAPLDWRSAFHGNNRQYANLESLTLGPQAEIDLTRLSDLTHLQALHVEYGHATLHSQDGVLFTDQGSTLRFYPPRRPDHYYTAPAETRRIADGAFANAAYLQQVTLPDHVQLGTAAFQSCYVLEAATFGVHSDSLPDYLFENCQSLQWVQFPTPIHTVGTRAFADTRLREITLTAPIEHLGTAAFETIGSLTITVIDAQMRGLPRLTEAVWMDRFFVSSGRLGRSLTLRVVDGKGALLDLIWIPETFNLRQKDALQAAFEGTVLHFAACDAVYSSILDRRERVQYAYIRHKTLTHQGCRDAAAQFSSYLRRSGYGLASRMVSNKDEPGILYLLRHDLLTDTAIGKLIPLCQQAGCLSALAYLLDSTEARSKSHNMPL